MPSDGSWDPGSDLRWEGLCTCVSPTSFPAVFPSWFTQRQQIKLPGPSTPCAAVLLLLLLPPDAVQECTSNNSNVPYAHPAAGTVWNRRVQISSIPPDQDADSKKSALLTCPYWLSLGPILQAHNGQESVWLLCPHQFSLNALLNMQTRVALCFVWGSLVLLSSSRIGLPSFSCPCAETWSEALRQRFETLSWVISVWVLCWQKPHLHFASRGCLGSLGVPAQGNVLASSAGFVLPHIQKHAWNNLGLTVWAGFGVFKGEE